MGTASSAVLRLVRVKAEPGSKANHALVPFFTWGAKSLLSEGHVLRSGSRVLGFKNLPSSVQSFLPCTPLAEKQGGRQ